MLLIRASEELIRFNDCAVLARTLKPALPVTETKLL